MNQKYGIFKSKETASYTKIMISEYTTVYIFNPQIITVIPQYTIPMPKIY